MFDNLWRTIRARSLSRARAHPRGRRPGVRFLYRPRLEVLEDRVVPSLFGTPLNFTTGTNNSPAPATGVVGDFNSDGKPDLAVTNYRSNTVSVLLGNGNGTFQSPINTTDSLNPISVAAGDFNGDGRLDLAVANASSGNVSVFLGNGDGTFQNAVNYSVGGYPHSVIVGDFNGDGKLDLAVANASSNTVSVLLGSGDGTFQSHVDYNVGKDPNSLVMGDFNGDGVPDLAVSNQNSGTVSLLLGNGNGTFQSMVNSNTGTSPNGMAVGDFNHDGKLDLAVANAGSATVSVLLGNGDGTFQNPVNYNVGASPFSVAVADFNGDGEADLAVANGSSNSVSVLLGKGDGTFQKALNYAAGTDPVSVTVGDFNRDGKPDLGVVDGVETGAVILNELAGSVTSLKASVNPPVFGELATLTVTVDSAVLGLGTPTGQVVFEDGGVTLGSPSLLDGTATLTVTLPGGGQQVTASYAGDGSFGPSSASLSVAAYGAPAVVSVAGGGTQSTPIGSPFGTLFQAEVKDAFGNPVPNIAVTFSAPVSGASGTFDATTTVPTNALGIATAPAFTANTVPGKFSVTASVAGTQTPAVFDLTNTAGIAAAITVAGGGSQTSAVGSAYGSPLQAEVTDAFGNPVAGVSVTFTAPATGASGNFSGATTVIVQTNAQGIAAPTFTANTVPGSFTVTATVAGLSTPASFNLKNTPGAPAKVIALSGGNQYTLVASPFAQPLLAEVLDAYDNPVPGVTVSFAVSNTPGLVGNAASATFAQYEQTDALGVVTLPDVTANIFQGSYLVEATASGALVKAEFSLTNVASNDKIQAVSGSGQSVPVGQQFAPLKVKVTDRQGKPVPGITVVFNLPTSGASGSFALAQAVTDAQGIATSDPITADNTAGRFPVVVTLAQYAVPARFTLTNTSLSATVGHSYSLSVVLVDSSGNGVRGVKVMFAVTAGTGGAEGLFPGNKSMVTVVSGAKGVAAAPSLIANHIAGGFTVAVSYPGSAGITFDLTNEAGPAASVALVASTNKQSTTVSTAFGKPLAVKVTDAFNNPVSGVTVSFNVNANVNQALATFPTGIHAIAVTGGDGQATAPPLIASGNPGPFTVSASVKRVRSSANFILTITASPVCFDD